MIKMALGRIITLSCRLFVAVLTGVLLAPAGSNAQTPIAAAPMCGPALEHAAPSSVVVIDPELQLRSSRSFHLPREWQREVFLNERSRGGELLFGPLITW